MTDYIVDYKSFRLLAKRSGLSPARMLAHQARRERNAGELERQKRDAPEAPVDEGAVTVRVRVYAHLFLSVEVSP